MLIRMLTPVATGLDGTWKNLTVAPSSDHKIIVLGLWIVTSTAHATIPTEALFDTEESSTERFRLANGNGATDMMGDILRAPFFCGHGKRLTGTLVAGAGDATACVIYGEVPEHFDLSIGG